MHISWLGYAAFKLQYNGVTVITDPCDTEANFKINKQQADIVLTTINDPATASAAVSGSPFVIHEPGEYEVKSVFVYGTPLNGRIVYLIEMDEVSIAFLGGVKAKELSDKELEILEGADILIVPVGGGRVSSAKEAVNLINQVEPTIVIPSQYRVKGSKGLDDVGIFLKEYSAPREELDKLKIQKKDVQREDTKVVILKEA